MERFLIINADDLGLSKGVNEGIVRAHRDGILTSASLMVRGAAAEHAVQVAGDIDLGLHIDLSEWAYRDGQWMNVYQRVPSHDREAIEREIQDQATLFEKLTGRLPSHLDSHQHVHYDEPVRSIAVRAAAQLGIPLRGQSRQIRYCGSFYGQSGKGAPCAEAISVDSLLSVLASLPAGVTELGCHPGDDPQLESAYCVERLIEVATLCDPRVRSAVEEQRIRLITFDELSRLTHPSDVQHAERSHVASSPHT